MTAFKHVATERSHVLKKRCSDEALKYHVQFLMHHARDFVMATGGLERFSDPPLKETETMLDILGKLGACQARKIGSMNKKSFRLESKFC